MSKKSPAKILKEKGLIPKEWDLRKPLSKGQKSWITKQSTKYAQLVKRPGDFTIKRVGKSTAQNLKSQGYAIERNKAVIPTKNGAKARILRGNVEIVRPHQTERIMFRLTPETMPRFERLMKKRLKKNQAWALRIGENPLNTETSNSISPDLKWLWNYAVNFRGHSPDAKNHMYLVLITVHSGKLVDHATDDESKDLDEWEDDEEK
jgi:hypothetical protein